ncbi:MAG: hypothetical protein M3Y72_06200 [Acidobacteriota bacterium]|nr:hypothetical protein [Acidobacteriota bacterium]
MNCATAAEPPNARKRKQKREAASPSTLPEVSPAILEEFGADFIREANEIRHRVEARIARTRTSPKDDLTPAGRSTGPRTPEGKATASQNSFKHGLASGQILIAGEDPAEFATLLADLIEHHQPANRTEEILVREMVDAHWLMARASRLQANCFTNDEIDTKALALFMRYRATYERAFYKALNTLVKLQKESARKLPKEETVRGEQFVSRRTTAPREAKRRIQPQTAQEHSSYEAIELSEAPETSEVTRAVALKVA